MKSSINVSKENESAKPNPITEKIKSDYFLQKLYDNMTKKKKLEIVKYNKRIQNRINLSVKNYKEYLETFSSIEIEIIPKKDKYGEFINIDENDKLYYHIYFNDNKEEIKNKYTIKKKNKVRKIKIIIDYQVKSFKELFYWCKCIESINFKKFYRNNITDMSYMFAGCSSLKELNLNNFNTNNVTNMSYMFYGCSSLTNINLPNFNTNNVTNMRGMFKSCHSLNLLLSLNFNSSVHLLNIYLILVTLLVLKLLRFNFFNDEHLENISTHLSYLIIIENIKI